jgi:hypothetical protein
VDVEGTPPGKRHANEVPALNAMLLLAKRTESGVHPIRHWARFETMG